MSDVPLATRVSELQHHLRFLSREVGLLLDRAVLAGVVDLSPHLRLDGRQLRARVALAHFEHLEVLAGRACVDDARYLHVQ